MTSLALALLRWPDGVGAQRRVAAGPVFTIGRVDARAPAPDWMLDDPTKQISRVHCQFERLPDGRWQVLDRSTNGTFVNDEAEPVGRDRARMLRDGDRIRLGEYEIEARADSAPAAGVLPFNRFDPLPSPGTPVQAMPASGGFGGVHVPGLDDLPGGGAAPLHPRGASLPDTGSALDRAYQPPPAPSSGMLPPDFAQSVIRRAGVSYGAPDAAPTAAPVTAPLARPAATPHVAMATVPPTTPPTSPPTRPSVTASTVPPAAPADGLTAFLQGCGLPEQAAWRAAAEPMLALRAAGAMLRAAVAGMRELLRARSAVKGAFRAEQTMFGGSPLKFSPDDDAALALLLNARYDDGPRAVQEAVDDLKRHEMAVTVAMQAAVRALLEALSPDALEREDNGGGGLQMPGAQDKRLWQAFRRRHAALGAQLDDSFQSPFGIAFSRAYEQALAGEREPPPSR